MEWQDKGIIIGVKPHGETSLIVELMTRGHGRHKGLVKGGRSRRQMPLLQAGNRVEAHWQARLAEHMGLFRLEGESIAAPQLMAKSLSLYALQTMADLLRLLPERDPYPELYDILPLLLGHFDAPLLAGEIFMRFELRLLAQLGFGLDLSRCAASGKKGVIPKPEGEESAAAGHNLAALAAFAHPPAAEAAPPFAETAAAAFAGPRAGARRANFALPAALCSAEAIAENLRAEKAAIGASAMSGKAASARGENAGQAAAENAVSHAAETAELPACAALPAAFNGRAEAPISAAPSLAETAAADGLPANNAAAEAKKAAYAPPPPADFASRQEEETVELAYVSPRTGRAVGRLAGAPWRDKLLPLPPFLLNARLRARNFSDIAAAARLTGFFLMRNVFEPRGLTPPPFRDSFLTALAAAIAAARAEAKSETEL